MLRKLYDDTPLAAIIAIDLVLLVLLLSNPKARAFIVDGMFAIAITILRELDKFCVNYQLMRGYFNVPSNGISGESDPPGPESSRAS